MSLPGSLQMPHVFCKQDPVPAFHVASDLNQIYVVQVPHHPGIIREHHAMIKQLRNQRPIFVLLKGLDQLQVSSDPVVQVLEIARYTGLEDPLQPGNHRKLCDMVPTDFIIVSKKIERLL